MTYTKTVWVSNTNPPINAANLNKIENALESALANSGVTAGTYTLTTFTVNAEGKITSASSGAPGAIADASTTVKGASKASVAPASATNPIFVGDNDPRAGAATTSQRALMKSSVSDADPVAIIRSDPILETHINGLDASWVSSTQISISSGSAWIPSLGRVYNSPSAITVTPTLSASAWIYLYLWDNAGTPAIEASTTAPAAPYKGTARTKTSDTSKRYIGEVLSNSGATALLKTRRRGNEVFFQESSNASPLLFLSDGVATTATTVSCTSVVPATAATIYLRVTHKHGGDLFLSNPDANFTLTTTNYLTALKGNTAGNNTHGHFWMSLSSAQGVNYIWSGAPSAGNGLFLGCLGYTIER